MIKKRMIIPVSFDNEDDYMFVKNKPNSAHYIRTLVRKDRENKFLNDKFLEGKIEELKNYIDKQLSNIKSNKKIAVNEIDISEDLKEDIKKTLFAFD